MSNELNNIIARNSDGVYEGVAIGGDRYPGTRFIDHLLRYQDNPAISVRTRNRASDETTKHFLTAGPTNTSRLKFREAPINRCKRRRQVLDMEPTARHDSSSHV